ncbi:hypothetical protein Unana1_08610 [Umbelopsis nana]
MSLEIDPSQQLDFRGPFTRHVDVPITIRNPSSQLVAYKIKTTAPKQYCVKPNSGRIGANSSVSIQVTLQPYKTELAPDFKCKDKFLIQSIALTPETENVSLADLWTSLENGPRDKINQKKLKCVFLSEHEVATPEVAKPEGEAAHEEYTNANASRPSSPDDLTKSQDPSRLRQELADARETIQRMQEKLDTYTGGKATTVQTALVPTHNAGYPAELFTTTTVVSLLGVIAILVTAYAASALLLPKSARAVDRNIFIWLCFDALIHFIFEGSFLWHSTFGRTVFRGTGPFAELWKEYAKADVRWGMADPTVVSLEFLTVFGAGPLCVLLMYQIARNDPARYYNYIVLSVAELYGGWMTFCPEWLTGSVFLNTDNWLHYWLYLWFFNGIWVIIPGYLLYHAYVEIVYPLRAHTQIAPVEKEAKKE